jgi:hypothetical protein
MPAISAKRRRHNHRQRKSSDGSSHYQKPNGRPATEPAPAGSRRGLRQSIPVSSTIPSPDALSRAEIKSYKLHYDAQMTRNEVSGRASPQISPLRYAPVEMTKGRVAADREVCYGNGAGPQISPLRCASVEMTKGKCAANRKVCYGNGAARRSLHSASLRSR